MVPEEHLDAEATTLPNAGMRRTCPFSTPGELKNLARKSRTLVVHIGMPKTGSTSLQHMLWTLAGRLRRYGVHVPVSGQDPSGSHCNLVREYTGHGRSTRYRPLLGGWCDLLQELASHRGASGASRFVISCEAFSHPQAAGEAVGRLLEVARAADLDLEIVGYVRPQHQQMEAHYAQVVGAEVRSFETFRAAAHEDPRFDYNERFRPWRAAFGDRVAIYAMGPAYLPHGVLPHFLDLLGAGRLAPIAAALPRLNRRMGAKHLEVMRRFHAVLRHQMVDRPVIARLSHQLMRTLPAVLVDDASASWLAPEERRAISEHFAASNARFARDYAVDGLDTGLFRETAKEMDLRPNFVRWADFGVQERTAVVCVVRDLTGIDPSGVAGTLDDGWRLRRQVPGPGGGSMARTSPAQAAQGEFCGRSHHRVSTRWRLLVKGGLRHTIPAGFARFFKSAGEGVEILRYRYYRIRATLDRLLRPGRYMAV